jgi:hypothetical protein
MGEFGGRQRSEVGSQKSALPLAAGAASLIEKETREHRTSNVQHRILNEGKVRNAP